MSPSQALVCSAVCHPRHHTPQVHAPGDHILIPHHQRASAGSHDEQVSCSHACSGWVGFAAACAAPLSCVCTPHPSPTTCKCCSHEAFPPKRLRNPAQFGDNCLNQLLLLLPVMAKATRGPGSMGAACRWSCGGGETASGPQWAQGAPPICESHCIAILCAICVFVCGWSAPAWLMPAPKHASWCSHARRVSCAPGVMRAGRA